MRKRATKEKRLMFDKLINVEGHSLPKGCLSRSQVSSKHYEPDRRMIYLASNQQQNPEWEEIFRKAEFVSLSTNITNLMSNFKKGEGRKHSCELMHSHHKMDVLTNENHL